MRSFFAVIICGSSLFAQEAASNAPPADLSRRDLSQQVTELYALVQKLQARVDELEARLQPPPAPPAETALEVPTQQPAQISTAPPPPAPDLLHGTTVNLLFDGYYGYNFNSPIGRANLLRAYDVSSNSFSLNQADLVIENAPDPTHGKIWGARLDLQFGQATQTLQGNPVNEPRPDIYRNVFQAYGTLVLPAGKGLTLDFGKWSSSLGIEGNYTQDQINYSRSYWFAFLPFYHMGLRASYNFNDKIGLSYWITNGTQQTEAFNNFKDQFAGINLQPTKNLSWKINYYLGQEHPDVIFFQNGVPPQYSNLPSQQGVPYLPIANAPTGKLHIFDSYATWQATPKLTLAADGDYVIERQTTTSAPSYAIGGTGYFRYQIAPKFAAAARAEYMSDHGGLFSGVSQALKEVTLTGEYKLADGFLMRLEWRRDFSNHPYFYTDTLGILSNHQATATVGLVWWVGGKQGAW